MTGASGCLVLRLAGPLQSWGGQSRFNRRDTQAEPTKSGLVGLLAAALGRRRTDSIEDLVQLELGVRTDRPGSLLRDYHTVSDFRGGPLLSAAVTGRGTQKPTSPAKHTHVTHRFYLQDAVFVAAIHADLSLVTGLAEAIRAPAFPLALGRRACVPTQPVVLAPPEMVDLDHPDAWPGRPGEALAGVPWQASDASREARTTVVQLPITVDDVAGAELLTDVPISFAPGDFGFTTRRVRHDWVKVPTGAARDPDETPHDPFALLGW